jgi:hypothetical protein
MIQNLCAGLGVVPGFIVEQEVPSVRASWPDVAAFVTINDRQ